MNPWRKIEEPKTTGKTWLQEDEGGRIEKERTCTHPEHEPPRDIPMDSGQYEHICPGCRRRISVSISRSDEHIIPKW